MSAEYVPSPVAAGTRVKAVLFDLDGTLYRQRALRSLMALELLGMPFTAPLQAPKRWRALAAYRGAQERLREADGVGADAQLAAACRESGMPRTEVEALVAEWIMKRPLKYLRLCRAPGLVELLDFLAGAGVRCGILSDYPAVEKLRALGLGERFSPVLCSSDPDIAAFKPHPRGFLRACEHWGLEPSEVLVVGDRLDVDAAGAAASGMPCVIVGRPSRRAAAAPPPNCVVLSSFERLHRVLDHRC